MPVLDFDKIKDDLNLYNHRPSVFSWPVFGTLLFGAILFVFYKLNQYIFPWNTWQQAAGNARDFCEMNREQLIVQPANTWSNLGFIIVGWIFLSIAKNDHNYFERVSVDNLLAKFPGFTYLIGFSTLYMGFGSFLYHGTLTLPFQRMDQTGMYFLLISFLAYNLFKLFPILKFNGTTFISNKFFIISAIILQLIFYFFLWQAPINILFPALTLTFFFTNFMLIHKVKNTISFIGFLKAAFITLLIASTIWILDITNKLCAPTSVFQGHALWHILCSISIFLSYLYYRSETFLTKEDIAVIQNDI